MRANRAVLRLVQENLRSIQRTANIGRTYYTGTVDDYSVVRWILQWEDERSVRLAILLLQHLHFIDSGRLGALLQSAIAKIPATDQRSAAFTTMGRPFDSGGLVSYTFSKSLGISEEEFAAKWHELVDLADPENSKDFPVIMLDDNIASGTQLERLFSELTPGHKGEREHFKKPLKPEQLKTLRKRRFYIAVAVQLGDPAAALDTIRGRLGFNVRVVFGEQDGLTWFTYGNSLWNSREEVDFARNRVAGISRSLLKAKRWERELLENRLLGYGNQPKLTVFQHNIPKSLPAPFWKFEEGAANPWVPLFPERAEWEQFENQIQRANQKGDSKWELARRIVDSGSSNRTADEPSTSVSKRSKPALPFYTVPALPPHYLVRANALAELRRKVLIKNRSREASSDQSSLVGVQGMGGVGKTVLTSALTRDAEVVRSFPDGIFWLVLGQQPQLLGLLNRLASWLPQSGGPFALQSDAQYHLRQALVGKRVLLILDDVWELESAAILNVLSGLGCLLVTTRNREVLVGLGADELKLDVLSLPEALRMVAGWAGVADAAHLPDEAAVVAKECGCLPLALAMVGAMVRMRSSAWQDALELLQRKELGEFHRSFPDYPYPDLFRAIEVSVENLASEDRDRYLDLAVFAGSEAIPESALRMLWGLESAKTRVCMDRLAARSLANLQEIEGRATLSLHDLQSDYIQKVRSTEIHALHTRILKNYAAKCEVTHTSRRGTRRWADGVNDGYFFQHLIDHLLGAGRSDESVEVLLDLKWLEAKNRNGMTFALLDEFSKVYDLVSAAHSKRHLLPLVRDALRREIHFITRHAIDYPQALFQCLWNSGWWYDCSGAEKHYLPPSNLRGQKERLSELLGKWHREKQAESHGFFWIRSMRPPFVHLGAFQSKSLRGTGNAVLSVSFSPDGLRLASVGNGRLTVWDAASGAVRDGRAFEGFNPLVVLFSPNGSRLFVAGSGSIYLLSIDRLQEQDRVCALGGAIRQISVSADGRHLAAATARTLTVIELNERRKKLFSKEAGKNWGFGCIALSHDGKRLAAINGQRLIIWDIEIGAEAITLDADPAGCLAFSPDNRAIAVSKGQNLEIYNALTARREFTLKGHTDSLTAICYSRNGERIATGSTDRTVRVWDIKKQMELHCFRGHSAGVNSVAFSSDDRWIASGSTDTSIMLWDTKSSHKDHWERVDDEEHAGCVFSADGSHLYTGSIHGSIRVWKTATGRMLPRRFEGDQGGSSSLALAPDGLRIAGTGFGEASIWETSTGKHILTLCDSTVEPINVEALQYSPDGSKVLGCIDTQNLTPVIVVWNANNGREEMRIENVQPSLAQAIWTPDGRTIVGLFKEGFAFVWKGSNGITLRTFAIGPGVEHGAFSVDGELLVTDLGHRPGVNVWSFRTGELLNEFDGRVDVKAIAQRHRFFAFDCGSEVQVVHAATMETVAWFSEGIRAITAHPSGKIWAGAENAFLQLVKLEGGIDPAPKTKVNHTRSD